jgi:hypothetical protein
MRWLVGIFALLTGAAGWFYLFYSRAAHRLSGIEDQRLNDRRIALRRVGGVVMLLLGALFFAGFVGLDKDPAEQSPAAVLGIWGAVLVLLVVIVVLALIDLRLTSRLRAKQKGLRP